MPSKNFVVLKENIQSVCIYIQSDAGSPLVVFDKVKKVWRLEGIAAVARGCGRAPQLGVFGRVAVFNDFILQTIDDYDLF